MFKAGDCVKVILTDDEVGLSGYPAAFLAEFVMIDPADGGRYVLKTARGKLNVRSARCSPAEPVPDLREKTRGPDAPRGGTGAVPARVTDRKPIGRTCPLCDGKRSNGDGLSCTRCGGSGEVMY